MTYNSFKSSNSLLDVLLYVFAAKNCEWGSWTEGACDKTCGGGVRSITRTKQVQESNGGYCHGPASKFESCNNQKCPGESFLVTFAFGRCFDKIQNTEQVIIIYLLSNSSL